MICTWAGNGEPAFYGDGLDRREAMLYWPMDLAFAPDGRAYVLDWQNHRVRRVNADDTFETVLGTGDVGDGPDTGDERTAPGVAGTDCNLNHPTDLTFDGDGRIVLAAWHNHKIRRFDPATGMEEVLSGAGPGFKGDGTPALGALLSMPKSVAVSRTTGAIYLADTRNFRVRRIGSDGVIETVVGGGQAGFAGDGGPPAAALLAFQMVNDNPEPGGALAIDDQDRLYIADTENQRIRRVDFAADTIETVAGNGTAGFSGDGGPATEASLAWPRDIALGRDGPPVHRGHRQPPGARRGPGDGRHHDVRGRRERGLRRRRGAGHRRLAEAALGHHVRRGRQPLHRRHVQQPHPDGHEVELDRP